MKQPIKRLTALILAMAMCLSLLSVNVWAAEPEPSEASSAQSSEEATVAEEPAEESALAEEETPTEESALEEETPAEESASTEEEASLTPQGIVASGTCGDNVTWTLDDAGKLTISGTGPMYNYHEAEPGWGDSIKSAAIQSGVTSISDSAFYCCYSLTSVTIPNTVTSIDGGAFWYCKSLASVTIPNSVTSIGEFAFYGCKSLASVTIPNSVTSIGEWAFGMTPWLKNQGDLVVINGILQRYQGNATKVTIPSSVTSIAGNAFYECDSLTSITIPDSVTSIGGKAFCECDSLTSIIIPDSVTSIGGWAFENCHSLTSVTIPNTVTEIDEGTFAGCPSLTSITIPNSVTSIGSCAFSGCASLTSVNIPDRVTSIGSQAFYECGSLTSVAIPNSVTSIGSCAFFGTPWLMNQGDLAVINGILHRYQGNATKVTIPSSVTSIGGWAFEDCTSLTSVTIPNSVTSIGEWAFIKCTSLTNVTIPNSVTSIGDEAFGFVWDSYEEEFIPVGSFTISGYTGTAAETYAKSNNFNFVALDAPAHEHNWINGTVTTRATCKSKGVMTFTCSGCPEKKTVPIDEDAKNHVGGTEIRGAKTATCGKEGYTGDTYCKGCGAKLSSGKKTPATGKHKWDAGKVTKQPTTTKEGVKTYTCKVCKKTKTEPIKRKNTISCKDTFTKVANAANNQTVALKASANGAHLSYTSNDKMVTVKGGTVTIKKGFAGKATITITAKETKKYLSATKKVTVSVKPDAGVKLDKKKKVATVSWTKCTVGKGYEIQIAPKKDFKKITKTVTINKKTTASTAVKGLKAGTYYVRVRLLNGEKGSDWSAAQSFTIAK